MSSSFHLSLSEEASDPATSAERLTELSIHAELRSIVAGNPATPAHILERMVQDQGQIVASNPNTPWKTLELLARQFPQEFLHNPAGPLQLMAYPEQITTDELFWANLLVIAPLPSWWWNWLKNHPILRAIPAVRLHVQNEEETASSFSEAAPEEEGDLLTLAELLTTACVRGALFPALVGHGLVDPSETTGEQATEKYVQWLAQRGSDNLRAAVASNKHMLPEILCPLAQDLQATVREKVASNMQTPGEVLHLLAQDLQVRVRSAVAWNERTPPEALLLLAQDPDPTLEVYVARNKQTPGEILRRLAQQASVGVRMAVAGNRHTPADVLRMLAQDQDTEVRERVAKHEHTPADVLLMLAQDQDTKVREGVATNPQAPQEALRTLAQDQDTEVREGVARNKQTSAKMLQTLAQEEGMWRILASNPQTPLDVLQAMAQSRDPWVWQDMAMNPQTPSDVLQALAQDKDEFRRRAVASNPQLPSDVLQVLAQDEDEFVRRAVAMNPRTSIDVLQTLAQQNTGVKWWADLVLKLLADYGSALRGQQWWGQLRWFASPEMSDDYLRGFILQLKAPEAIREAIGAAFIEDWSTRNVWSFLPGDAWQWVMIPSLPTITLQRLALSPSWEVRYLVALHNQTPQETRQQLNQDGNRYVRAVARAQMEMKQRATENE